LVAITWALWLAALPHTQSLGADLGCCTRRQGRIGKVP
jgi:hypothetical protein